jgi:hypothetical protein
MRNYLFFFFLFGYYLINILCFLLEVICIELELRETNIKHLRKIGSLQTFMWSQVSSLRFERNPRLYQM